MGALIFLILFLVFSFQSSIIEVTNATKFSDAGPDIHYPFHIKGQQPQYDALPGFELLHKENNITTIHFPSYVDLVVKSISYDTKRIDLLDPKNCAHQVFLNLNLSLTPFHYYHLLKNYTYLNCSTSLPPPFKEVPCLSASNYHVYTVDPGLPVPRSCKGVKTIAIPFKYSPYLTDNSLGLRLTWNLHESEHNKARNQTSDPHTARFTVLGLSMCVFLAAILIGIKVHVSMTNFHQKEGLLSQSQTNF